MSLIGAELMSVEPGVVEIAIGLRDDLTQQNGFMHAGIVTTILDSACGYAAYTLMPAATSVLSVEFKVNLLSPATGERIVARAEVKRAGKLLTVCTADAIADGRRPESMDEPEAAAYDFSIELHRRRSVSDATYARAHKHFGEHGIIYLIGLIVVILAILSFFGLR